MTLEKLFTNPKNTNHRKYEILRSYIVDKLPAKAVAKKYKTTQGTVFSYFQDFKKSPNTTLFFSEPTYGRKQNKDTASITELVIEYRKKHLSVPDIKAILDSRKIIVSESQIGKIIKKEGFIRLPRRNIEERILSQSSITAEQAPISSKIKLIDNNFLSTQASGIFCFLPYLYNMGIIKLIENSSFPETSSISKVNSILSFLALKLSNFERYSQDDQWCMDAGLGLFAGLNVLPKTSWYSSYSHRITRKTNKEFLKGMNSILKKFGFLGDTVNLDFSSIPYWGKDTGHLSSNWSGTRNKSLLSILAALGQDPDTGIITYGDTTITEDKNDMPLEFLEFNKDGNTDLKWLVFDSKLTTYENLYKIHEQGISFITIRRRGSKIVEEISKIPVEKLKKISVPTSKGNRQVKIFESMIQIKGYKEEIRQIALIGDKRIKPALIITNNLKLKTEEIVRKYALRWMVEKEISEQIHFFHLNKVSSSIVIKVDFDLVMTILAHNLCKIFCQDLSGYENIDAKKLFHKFLSNSAKITISEDRVLVELKKKRHLPHILSFASKYKDFKIGIFENRKLDIQGWTTS
jgi:hypothetical protein